MDSPHILTRKMRTLEKDLIRPALQALADSEYEGGCLTTKELAKRLRKAIKPTEEDEVTLQGRRDDRLSQVIRNLVSHRTLERTGLAIYEKNPRTGEGYYRLSALGAATIARSGNTSISK